ncbi:MAG: hypothetical protein RJA70_4801 [Pseudomonadota bacterium]
MAPDRPNYLVRNASPSDWSRAKLLADFRYPWLARRAPRTHFRALVWQDRFHFLFDVENRELVLSEADDALTRVLDSDRVELFFAADVALEAYFGFEIDPRGGVHDFAAKFYRQFDNDWRFPGLEAEGALTHAGYRVAGSFPLATFRALSLLDAHTQNVRAGVYRADFSLNAQGELVRDWISWVQPETTTPDFHVPSSFGTFQLEQVR